MYLIYFSFKFKEIKFYTVFMNWLIQEKMFTYFYNKFRSVNCMHYTKCSVNSFITHITQLWLLQKAHGILDHYFITTHTIHNGRWFTNFLLCHILYKAPRTGACCIWHTYTPCPLCGHEMNRDAAEGFRRWRGVNYNTINNSDYTVLNSNIICE